MNMAAVVSCENTPYPVFSMCMLCSSLGSNGFLLMFVTLCCSGKMLSTFHPGDVKWNYWIMKDEDGQKQGQSQVTAVRNLGNIYIFVANLS